MVRATASSQADLKVRLYVCTIVLASSCLIGAQSGVQSFDRPEPGGRSPRNADYEIDVRLDHAARTLEGRETIRWRNISNRPTAELQFHLYWNAWRDAESTWLRERQLAGASTPPRDDAWGSSDVTAVRVRQPDGVVVDLTSRQRFIAPDDGNAADRTVMAVALPFDVQPNETTEIEVEWHSKIPRPFARTGYINDYYFVAQWFPKLGVLEDRGWNTHQFHAATEFYSDYGVYDVRITVPRGFVVGASGREVQRTDNADGTTTHRYRAEDVHDVAWTASPRFVDVRQAFEHPTLPRVEMRLLLQPEHAGQEARHFAATEAALRYYGEWFGPYPYDHLTIVDPAYQSGSGGMEYPTLFTAGARWIAPERVTQPESVTIHEAGHQFWYAIVGSNEFEHAWLDEGLNTFSTARVLEAIDHPNHLAARYFGGFVPWVFRDIRQSRATDGNRLPGYRDNAEADVPATPTWRYWPGTATAITYNKTALWLHTLERHLGWPTLQRIMATYFDRWKFRHPEPADFFAVVNEVSGQDLTWFFDQAFRSSNVFDYGVQDLASTRVGEGYRTSVVVRRFGEAAFPVDVVTRFRDGHQITERWDGLDRRVVYVYERPEQAVSAQVDPERVLLLDVNYTNNSRTVEPRAGEAAWKWSLKWLGWLQDLMLTYAFFV
ncbi:MAG: M1 family metallopeptidase [Acidobacteria bacterium]|nr:M1 family metallopeptidase [Acidobacteriota bacterium]